MRRGTGPLIAPALLLLTPDPVIAQGNGLVYELGPVAEVIERYPDASWLPEPYQKRYQDLPKTVKRFTKQSLERDGVDNPYVRVTTNANQNVQVTLKPVNATTRAFKHRHQTFIDGRHAGQARHGVEACKNVDGCWSSRDQKTPWAMFLPLGLPMVNQQAVMLLDYPPADSLRKGNYLKNFTMCRWTQVLGSSGIAEPRRYESIVDARPIAAPGSGAGKLPTAERYFDSQNGPGGNYIQPMLSLLTAPPDPSSSGAARPVGVFGSPARSVWASITGQESVDVLETGTTKLSSGAEVAWIGTNHPDVTTYKSCSSGTSDDEAGLIQSESTDLTAACWLEQMAQHPEADPDQVRQKCQKRWFSPQDNSRQRRLCVRAKLDTNDEDARCGSYEQARRYCAQHDNNPCATNSCQIKEAGSDSLTQVGDDGGSWRRICHY